MEEKDIIQLLLDKDNKGIEFLIIEYGPLIRYIINPILPIEEDREDCLQEISLTIWEKINLFNPDKASFKTWITSIARNLAINKYKQMSKSKYNQDYDENLEDLTNNPESLLLTSELKSQIIKAISHLSISERNIFYRKYYYLQSVKQIASELSTTDKAIESKLFRIRKKLKKSLGGKLND